MNRKTLAYALTTLVAAAAGCGGGPIGTSEDGLTKLPPIVFQLFRIDIESVEPAVPFEGQPMHIVFNLVNNTNDVKTGWVGAAMQPTNQGPYDNDMTTDWAIGKLPAHSSARGEVTIPAPAHAAPGQGFSLYYYETRPMVGEFLQKGPHIIDTARYAYDLGARYYVDLTTVEAVHTREPDLPYRNDHDVFTCGGKLAGGAERKCVTTDSTPMFGTPGIKDIGDVHQFKPLNVEMGPFVTVPRTGPSLTVAYAGLNYGSADSNIVRSVMNGASTITSDILQAVYPSFAAALKAGDSITQQLNDLIAPDCNGLVSDDTVTWSSTDLDSLTQATGSATQVRQDGTDPLPPGSPYITPAGCGAHPIYNVTSVIRRVPWGASDRLVVTPTQKRVRSGSTFHLATNDPNPAAVTWFAENASADGYFSLSGDGIDFTVTRTLNMQDMFEVTAIGSDGSSSKAYVGGPLPLVIVRWPPPAITVGSN